MILINASHGAEDPERATLPLVLASNAVLAGQETVVLLTIEAVRLATKGGADGVQKEGLPPVADLLRDVLGGGGQVWACQACTKPRGITEDDLIDGARIGSAMEVVELMSRGDVASLTF